MPEPLWYAILALTAAFGLPVLALAVFGARASRLAPLVAKQSAAISWLSTSVGVTVAWLVLFMVLVQFAVVVMRYVFGFNSIALQESILYAHGAMFMLASAYTLFIGGHVRVDIFYHAMNTRNQAWVDLLGTALFLVPFMLLVLNFSWNYVEISWRIHEASRETSGLPGVFLLKTVILVFAGLMLLQGMALAGKAALFISGQTDIDQARASAP